MKAFIERIRSWRLKPSLSGISMILNGITLMIVFWTWSMIGQQKTENERTLQFLRDNRHVQVGEWMWVHSKLLSLRDSIGYQEEVSELLDWSAGRCPPLDEHSIDDVRKWVKRWEDAAAINAKLNREQEPIPNKPWMPRR